MAHHARDSAEHQPLRLRDSTGGFRIPTGERRKIGYILPSDDHEPRPSLRGEAFALIAVHRFRRRATPAPYMRQTGGSMLDTLGTRTMHAVLRTAAIPGAQPPSTMQKQPSRASRPLSSCRRPRCPSLPTELNLGQARPISPWFRAGGGREPPEACVRTLGD
ncbi:hypothetical protein GGG16DRAFT_119862 [Schizophyllum commune]